MALLAIRADTGTEVESFSTPADVWAEWRKLPLGTFVVGRHRVPAVLKRSIRGLQFFAAASGYGGTTAPESIEHQLAKIGLVRGLRAAGYDARVEQPGATPEGDEWQADVFVRTPSQLIAIEVQLARQHWDDFRHRTERYTASGVSCVWLVRQTFWSALGKGRIRFLMNRGLSLDDALNRGLDDMPCFPLVMPDKEPTTPETMHVVVHPVDRRAPFLRLSLGEFGVGVAAGAMQLGELRTLDGSRSWRDWMWGGELQSEASATAAA